MDTNRNRDEETLIAELRSLPAEQPSAALHERLVALASEPDSQRWRPGVPIAATALIAASALLAVRWLVPTPMDPEPAVQVAAVVESATNPDIGELPDLIARSAYLDQVAAALPGRGRVQPVAAASRISVLEDRVALLDAALDTAPADPAFHASLLRERVDLMDTIVGLQSRASGNQWL